ncbi:MAG: hypothetical protein KIT69_17265, partial [Propionibacteriaceae bacterium]|nr:hypothetical protein [Propionibacteriaceae bacterium]
RRRYCCSQRDPARPLGPDGPAGHREVLMAGARVEDATSYAALQAVGWRDVSLGSALAGQAVIIGVVGGPPGGALGIGLVV